MNSKNNLTILFFGDIVGKLGRRAIATTVPTLRKKYHADLVFANGENMAHGRGFTPTTADEVLNSGIDYLTSGDHCFDQHAFVDECFNGTRPILRPANYQVDAPGKGYDIIKLNGQEVLLINLIGRSFMPKHYEDPFRAAQAILADFTDKKFSAIIVDIHAETTAEKIALRHFLDGKISALLGTHTHVPTADAQVTKQGTGYITDLGMTGDADGVIGIAAQPVVASFLSQTKIDHELAADGRAQVNGVCLSIDPTNGHCLAIDLIQESVIIPPAL
jgi:metallophosphoesterase (TIGR00282 family)